MTSDSWKNLLPEIDIIPVSVEINTEHLSPIRKKKYSNVVYKNPFNYSGMKSVPKKAKKKSVSTVKKPKVVANSSNKWSCMICNEVARDKEDLMKHYEKHKDEEVKKSIGDEEDAVPSNCTVSSYCFFCQICSKEFTSLKSFERHTDIQHGEFLYTCDTCRKGFKNSYQFCLHNFNVHTTDNIYRCNHCDFTTEDKNDLKFHVNQHKEDYKYRCQICNKGFTVHSWYLEHENFHTGAMPFECEICCKSFPYTRYLIAHKKSMHPEVFTKNRIIHQCTVCNKRFAHKKSLLHHVRSHTGENAVLCEICGKRLSSSEHLKHHIRIHTGDKPHSCKVCGKAFAKKCNLTLHERVHSGEKPYVCKFCQKAFSQRSTVVIHERYHTGDRPYVCRLCNKGFVAKGLLGVHMKTCSGVP